MATDAQDAGAAGVIMGWVQMIRAMLPDGWSRFLPLFAICLGVVYSFTIRNNRSVIEKFVGGLMIGFTSAGAYAGTKALFEKKPAANPQ